VVYRYNTYVNTVYSNHGTESGGRWRGQRQYEVYNNKFLLSNGAGVSSLAGSRGGTGVTFNNTATLTTGAFVNQFADLSDYRSTSSYAPWGQCNGSSVWDGNVTGGYPCLDAPGQGQSDLISGTTPTPATWPHQALAPVYAWNNTVNGSVSNLVSNTSVVVENRDFYNTPKPGYTPYTYPHPLTTSPTTSPSPLSAPTNLIVR